MKKIFLALFVIAIGMTHCSTPNPATTTSGSDTLNTTRTTTDTSTASRDTTVRRDSLRLK